MISLKASEVSNTFMIGMLRSEMISEISVSPPCTSLTMLGFENRGVRIELMDSLSM